MERIEYAFAPETRFFDTAVGHSVEPEARGIVDDEASDLKFFKVGLDAVFVVGEKASMDTEVGAIDPGDGFAVFLVALEGHDRAEGFFAPEAHFSSGIFDDGRLDDSAGSLTAGENGCAFAFSIIEEGCDFFGGVIGENRAADDFSVSGIAGLNCFGCGDKFGFEFFVAGIVDDDVLN